MKRNIRTRDVIVGLAIVLASMVGMRLLKHYVENLPSENFTIAPEEQALFEGLHAQHRAESLQMAAQRRKWAAERALREERRQAYQDSQAIWKARREQWAEEKAARQAEREATKAYFDSLKALRPEKLPAGSIVDANAADTLTLQRVPGIGPVLARRILYYRQALGGFVSVSQVLEVEGVPASVALWFVVDEHDATKHVRRLDLNRDEFKTLLRHPYLSYEQVRAIAQFRHLHPILNLQTLRGLTGFTDEDVQRLAPYVSF